MLVVVLSLLFYIGGVVTVIVSILLRGAIGAMVAVNVSVIVVISFALSWFVLIVLLHGIVIVSAGGCYYRS